MAKKKDKGILLSPKHGVNPSLMKCECCGEDYGIAMLGKLKDDAEAPKEIYQGLCDSCQSVVDQGGLLVIEVKDGESGDNPYRTGRIIGLSKDAKERLGADTSICYMEESVFNKLFGNVEFKNNKEDENREISNT